MNYEAKKLAKKVCKKLEPVIAHAVQARPASDGGYTLLQGYRTALALCAAACFELGMSEEKMVAAIKASIKGFRAADAASKTDEPELDPFEGIKSVDFKPPAGWRRVEQQGLDQLSALYAKNKLRLAVSEIEGTLLVSISKRRHGQPGHPTDAQCKEVLDAFGLSGLKEFPMTASARYFRPDKDGAS